jgi:hypothetical protein
MGHDEGNTLKSQDHREGLKALPLKEMECGIFKSTNGTCCIIAPIYWESLLTGPPCSHILPHAPYRREAAAALGAGAGW